MIYGNFCSLTFQQKRKVWVFPPDRFVQWGPEDESFCRVAGYGREEERTETIHIPTAIIDRVEVDGSLSFRAVPNYREPV